MQTTLSGDPVRTRHRTVGAVVACAAVVLALGVGVVVDLDPQVRLDAAVSRALYAGDDRSTGLDRLLEVLTTPGVMWFRLAVFAPVVIWLALQRRWRSIAWVGTAIVLVSPLTAGLKEVIGRARPAFEAGGLEYGGLSHPSGHSSGVAALVTVGLVLAWPRLAPAARRTALGAGVCLVVLVGLTRMWLGVHFLSDVVGGWALGIGFSLAVALLLGGLPGGPAALEARR